MPKSIPSNLKLNRAGDQFLIIVPNYWGKGKTIPEAKLAVKRAGGKLTGQWVVYSVKGDTVVNDMGGMNYPRAFPPVKIASNVKEQ